MKTDEIAQRLRADISAEWEGLGNYVYLLKTDGQALLEERDRMKEHIRVLRQALRFYAEMKHWQNYSDTDGGTTAQQALAQTEGE